MTLPKVLQSSVDRRKLSMTIRGLVSSAVPIVLIMAPVFGWSVSADDFKNLTGGIDGLFQAVEGIILAVTGAVSAYWVLWGATRKLLVGLKFM